MQKPLVKLRFFLFTLGCLLTAPVFAETQYVTENLSTYLRKGAGDQFKIAGTIQAGEKITVLEHKGRYTLVRDSKNREGWILTTELTPTPSSKELTPQLQQSVQELSLKLNKIDADWQQRTAAMQRRTEKAEQQSSELLDMNAQLKRELDILKNKNRDLETMHDAEKREIVIQWFIYGGAVLGAGLLLGLLIPFILPKRRARNGWS